MIGRLLRALIGRGELELSPFDALPDHGWREGDLARCIADGWFKAPRGAPTKGQLCRITSIEYRPLADGMGVVLMFEFESVPGHYMATGFAKPEMAPHAPALPNFTRDLQRISERVKARQGER